MVVVGSRGDSTSAGASTSTGNNDVFCKLLKNFTNISISFCQVFDYSTVSASFVDPAHRTNTISRY